MFEYFKKDHNSDKMLDTLKMLFESSKEGVLIVDSHKHVLFANNAFVKLTDLRDDGAISENIFKVHNKEIISISEMIDIFHKRKENFKNLVVKTRAIRDNHEIPMTLTFKTFYTDEQKKEELLHIVVNDLSLEQALTESEHHHRITNLPNQLGAYSHIGRLISSLSSSEYGFALILLDIDNIVKIKAALGLTRSDNLIAKIGEILNALCKEMKARLFHISYNHFMIIAPQMYSHKEIEAFHKRIQTDFDHGLKEEFHHIGLTFSTGVSFYPHSGRSLDMLIDNAYKALGRAKEEGEGKLEFDDNLGLDDRDQDEEHMLEEMKQALANNNFELHYQPLIDIESGKIEGAEALVRWKHPKNGLISPNSFIPLAKKSGFIIELGKFIITQAIKQQKFWQDFYPGSEIIIAINLSLREIEIGGFAEFVHSQLLKFDIRPELIRFEIPEDIAMANTELAKKNFLALKRLGVSLALDNFGLGQSSLVHLKELPLDALKVDLSFMSDLVHNKNNQRLAKAMITLGKNFDLKVIVSGIENQSIYSIVKHYGCDIAQGYHFSKPVPVYEFQDLLRTYKQIPEPESPMDKSKPKKIVVGRKDNGIDIYQQRSMFKEDTYDVYRNPHEEAFNYDDEEESFYYEFK